MVLLRSFIQDQMRAKMDAFQMRATFMRFFFEWQKSFSSKSFEFSGDPERLRLDARDLPFVALLKAREISQSF